MDADLRGITVKTVSVTYERKLNLGDYQSATVGATLWADLEEDVNPQEALRSLSLLAKVHVREQAMPMLMGWKEKLRKMIATLEASERARFEALLTEPNLELVVGVPLEEVQDADQRA